MRFPGVLIIVLLFFTAASLLTAMLVGSVSIGLQQGLALLLGNESDTTAMVVWQLRIPRALSAFVVGGLLALAGVLMQVMLRNPLADPYILGVSGGAAVAALSAISIGLSGLFLNAAALVGALFSMVLVLLVARGRGGWNPLRLLLTGVVIAAGWGAIISFILATSPNTRIHGMLFWLMGDLTDSSLPVGSALILLVGLAIASSVGRSMNILARGDLQAASLGVRVEPLRLILYFLASLLTATAVTIAGTVGFVGLVVPHILRVMGASDHRYLLPCSVLLGGSLLTLSDTLARTLLAPQQLPVGVITALLGVPLYLFILNRGMQK